MRYRKNKLQNQFFSLIMICILTCVNVINTSETTISTSLQFDNFIPSNSFSTVYNHNKYNITKIDQYDEGLGSMNDLMIQDSLAFVATRWGGLLVFDITDLTEPVLVGSYNEPQDTIAHIELTSGVFVKEDIVFLADGANGLLILDITNIDNIIKIGEFKGDWRNYLRVFVEGNYAYVLAQYYNHLVIFDISTLSAPVKISERTFSGAFFEIQVENQIVFLTGSTSGIIVNATNPYNMSVITTFNDARASAINSNYFLTADEPNNLVIYNLSKLPTISMITNYTLPINGSVRYLCVNNNFAFVGSNDEIIAINITDITKPHNESKITNLNKFSIPSSWIKRKCVTFNELNKENILVFTDYQFGIFIYNFSKPSGNKLIGYYNNGKRTERITIHDEYVYVASHPDIPYYPSQLDIFTNINNTLRKVSSYYTRLNINDIVYTEPYILLASSNGIEVVNLSNPAKPKKIDYFNFNNTETVRKIHYSVEREILYLACDIQGLLIINATNIQNLTLLAQVKDFYGYGYRASDVYIYEDIAFVSDGQVFGGFGMIDVSDPKNPEIIDYVPLNDNINGIYVHDELLYLMAGSFPTLQIFNVSDVTNPVRLTEFRNEKSSNANFFYKDDIVYLTQRGGGLALIDVSNPFELREIISIKDSFTGLCHDVFVNDSKIFIADAWDGFEIWEIEIEPQKLDMERIFLFLTFSIISFTSFVTILSVLIKRKKPK